MTPVALSAYVRLKTRTNSTTLTNADLIIMANVVKDRLVERALDADEDLFQVPTYMNLVADQREYPLDSTILSRVKRVEAKLDGTSFIKLKETDLTKLDNVMTPEAAITAEFSNEEGYAAFDIMRKSIWIYSGTITSVTDGLRVWLSTYPLDISSMASATDMSVDPTTTTHGIPRALHCPLALGMVIEWKESRDKPIALSGTELKWDDAVARAIENLKRGNYDREIIGSVPDEKAWNDGNNL